MAASSHRSKSHAPLNLSELSLDLARLNATQRDDLAQRMLALFKHHLHTDRVSLLLLNRDDCRIERSYCIGFQLADEEMSCSQKVAQLVSQTRKPLLCFDVHEQPELLSPWVQNYRTDAFAVLPLIVERDLIGLLCLSNLSTTQLTNLADAGTMFDVIIAQAAQLAALVARQCITLTPEPPATQDELTLISSLNDRLDRSLDTRNVFVIFSEILSPILPLDALAVIHDRMSDEQSGVVCLSRPVQREQLNGMFSALAHQWQRRHRHAPLLDLTEATMLGGELMSEQPDCPAEPALGRFETFPVFIDNDLFAVAGLAASEQMLGDRRRMRLFSILLHQLLMHVKKALLMEQNQQMQTVDALTGLYSERHFYQMMEREFDRAARYRVPLCMLIIDVDHFKDVNEAYGFETGDMLLKEISRIIMDNIRGTDMVSRYSGERFILLLPETHYKNGEIMANRLRRFVENSSFFIPNTNVYAKVTVSIGVSSYLEHAPASLAQFVEFADTALYFAKRAGRNQVVGYSSVINMMMRDTSNEG